MRYSVLGALLLVLGASTLGLAQSPQVPGKSLPVPGKSLPGTSNPSGTLRFRDNPYYTVFAQCHGNKFYYGTETADTVNAAVTRCNQTYGDCCASKNP